MKRKNAAKLTDQDVIDIYGEFHFRGKTLMALAREYEVDPSTIGRVIRNLSHKHVVRPDEQEWLNTQMEVK